MSTPESIDGRLAVIESTVTRLELRLFGNGQPGEISALKRRITRLESWLWRGLGALGAAVGLMSWLVRK